jgi:hypothetical protein
MTCVFDPTSSSGQAFCALSGSPDPNCKRVTTRHLEGAYCSGNTVVVCQGAYAVRRSDCQFATCTEGNGVDPAICRSP